MLKRFFLNTLSSFVGTWIAIILSGLCVVVFFFAIVGKMSLSEGKTEQITKGSILKLQLDGEIVETDNPGQPDLTQLVRGDLEMPQTLDCIVNALRDGAENKNIEALYIECGALVASPATLDAIRHAVVEFKKSGKKVYAYGDAMTTGSYFIASVADRVYLNPSGMLEMNGMNSVSLYMKELFDKFGIEFQVVKVGTFKSAVEPYIMNEMSGPARAQLDTLYTNMWGYIREQIASSRKDKGVTPALIDTLINQRSISFASTKTAMEAGLVDSLIYGREINSRLALLVGKEADELNFVSPQTLCGEAVWESDYNSDKQIAVLYACGEIIDGSKEGIDYQTLVPIIVKLADDENVKGLVLRVNSPGGSAFGSDQIGEALDYFQKKGKPLAVSMGDYAASGGYWISCGANRIFADPLTITGSIGIFGLIPNVSGLTQKIGVNPQFVGTNPQAMFPTMLKPMDERQVAVLQQYVDRGYKDFTTRVAKGRKMKIEKVLQIAEGRVWDAFKAKEIGLVDQLGYLQDAITWTAKQCKIDGDYDLSLYPEPMPNFWSLLQRSNGRMQSMALKIVKPSLEEITIEYVRGVLTRNKVQARMPMISVTL